MTQDVGDPREACEDLGEPMADFLGGAASVPAFAAGAAPFIETGPGAIFAGAAAGYSAYDTVHDVVADNWDNVVCDNLADAFPSSSQVDWSATDPFSTESPFQSYIDSVMTPPEASVTFYDLPSTDGFSAHSGGGSDSSSYDGGGSSSDGGGGAPSD